jgi:hypothetical protein
MQKRLNSCLMEKEFYQAIILMESVFGQELMTLYIINKGICSMILDQTEMVLVFLGMYGSKSNFSIFKFNAHHNLILKLVLVVLVSIGIIIITIVSL